MSELVKLGDVEIEAYAQRHAYLTNRLGAFLPTLMERGQEIGGEGLVTFLGDAAYDVLTALIPNLAKRLPRWQFAGYGDQAAYDQAQARQQANAERGRYDEIIAARRGEGNLSDEEEARLVAEQNAIEIPEDPYDENEDKSPSFPEIVGAFETAVRVNRFDVLKGLTQVVDPTLLKAVINSRIAEAITSGDSANSALLPAGSGPSTSSGTNGRTSPQSAA